MNCVTHVGESNVTYVSDCTVFTRPSDEHAIWREMSLKGGQQGVPRATR